MLLYASLQLDKDFCQTGNPLWLMSMFKNLLIYWANLLCGLFPLLPLPLSWDDYITRAGVSEQLHGLSGWETKWAVISRLAALKHQHTSFISPPWGFARKNNIKTSPAHCTSSHLVSWWIQQGTTVAIKAFWSVEKFRFSSDSSWWSVSLWVCSVKVLCWPRILELCLHHTSCSDSMESLSGVHFVLWICMYLHMCAVCV